MKVGQAIWTQDGGWSGDEFDGTDAKLVFAFGDGEYFCGNECFEHLKSTYPAAQIVGCSTSGCISGATVADNCVVISALYTENAHFRVVFKDIKDPSDSFSVGQTLAKELLGDGLRHIFVLSDGLGVNGSELANGLNGAGLEGVLVSGGLAGDGTRFAKTFVMANSPARQGRVAAVGFYGDSLEIKTGCMSGWDEFGAQRIVTKSKGNVVYEIDDQPALDLYKKYLGEEAKGLPANGLRFPINIQKNENEPSVIRTLLAIDEGEHSLTFAGDVPQGYSCRLMKPNMDKLIDNAGLAAQSAKNDNGKIGICIAVSCVGRRIVLGQLVEEELEIMSDAFGSNVAIAGFYSYGEIVATEGLKDCQLHNQTMTVTAIYE